MNTGPRRLFRPLAALALGSLSLATLPRPASAQAAPQAVFTKLFDFGPYRGAAEKGVIQASDGNFYGTTAADFYDANNVHHYGTVYKITPAGNFTTLFIFDGINSGAYPICRLVEGQDGALYGTTNGGVPDANNKATDVYNGTVFKITTAGKLTTIHKFGGDPDRPGGGFPQGGLLAASDGSFYGTTVDGGANGDRGTLFHLAADGTDFTFVSLTTKEANPRTPLIYGQDGNIYGTARGNYGEVFRYVPSTGAITDIASPGTDEFDGGIALGPNGNFYGMAESGGPNNVGYIYEVTPTGGVSTLDDLDITNGSQPFDELLLANDGNFYGTTSSGGASEVGSIFQLTPEGKLTTLYDSTSENTLAFPRCTLAQGRDGRFYGVGDRGGSNNNGTFFALSLNPVITSVTTAYATVGKAFNYQIVGTNGPTSFGVAGLPPGLKVNAATGAITGTPTAISTRTLTLIAANKLGQGRATLTLVIQEVPVVNSVAKATATVGEEFSYQITATNHPTSYGVAGLPPGLKVNSMTGVISGIPATARDYDLTLYAYNASGKGTKTLTLTVNEATPAITSAATASATVGKAFSYRITATGHPTKYGVLGLPPGLTVDKTTGLISGTPVGAGTKSLTLEATNGTGTGSATLTLTISAP